MSWDWYQSDPSVYEDIWVCAWQNQWNDLCAQRRLRSALASAQADQNLHCPHEEALGPWLPIRCTAKTLIRLGRCPGWSESSLDAQVSLLALSCCGFFYINIWTNPLWTTYQHGSWCNTSLVLFLIFCLYIKNKHFILFCIGALLKCE